jgi:hypothetical protein
MTPLEIRKENARREREERRKQRNTLPPRQPAPAEHRAKLEEIRKRIEGKKP